MITKIKNPEQTSAKFDVAINEKSPDGPTTIAFGETTLHTSIPTGQPDISVRYTGTKSLVILETAFE